MTFSRRMDEKQIDYVHVLQNGGKLVQEWEQAWQGTGVGVAGCEGWCRYGCECARQGTGVGVGAGARMRTCGLGEGSWWGVGSWCGSGCGKLVQEWVWASADVRWVRHRTSDRAKPPSSLGMGMELAGRVLVRGCGHVGVDLGVELACMCCTDAGAWVCESWTGTWELAEEWVWPAADAGRWARGHRCGQGMGMRARGCGHMGVGTWMTLRPSHLIPGDRGWRREYGGSCCGGNYVAELCRSALHSPPSSSQHLMHFSAV
ncbi:hypothetical protein FIBSPDRAFT_900797 [Athelia psychrophila]|uniref:Uncharacterized protein n=1 Tax=Athelia psychrophila TaxID=1759441 RepID=A0A165Y0L9_9AGAM|nr:hypothetical protein FIBSPDRAFT_900797 [Fibularhizoctonia sp. CBS 109695]